MPKPPDRHIMERLAFIRYMYDLGIEQAAKPEPHSWTAVLTFHDAVELFLGLAASHNGADLDKATEFSAYWKLINAKILPNRLQHSGRMKRLNDARVAFKHHGNAPSPSTIEQCRRDVDTFFEAASSAVFGVDFDEIDLAAIVPHEETANYLRRAQEYANSGDLLMAMGGLGLAFEALVQHFSMASSWSRSAIVFGNWPTSPLSFGETLRPQRSHRFSGPEAELVKQANVVVEIQSGMRLMALGIDLARHAAFQLMTPRHARSINDPHPVFWMSKTMQAVLTIDDFNFGKTFVIESALSAARAERLIRTRTGQAALPDEDRNWSLLLVPWGERSADYLDRKPDFEGLEEEG